MLTAIDALLSSRAPITNEPVQLLVLCALTAALLVCVWLSQENRSLFVPVPPCR